MFCLCLGPKHSGKTHLLNSLQNPGSINTTTYSVPTIGTNLFTINILTPPHIRKKSNNINNNTTINNIIDCPINIKLKKTMISNNNKNTNNNHRNIIQIREIGGTMAPMWKNYLTDVDKIMYVVDTSNLCQISAAGI